MSSPTFPLQLGTHRNLPNPQTDGGAQTPRGGRYGEIYVDGIVPTKHLLADEGCYYTACMTPSQAALAFGIISAFSDTSALMVIGNGNSPGGNRIYLDYLKMTFSVAPASSTAAFMAIKIDSGARTPTAGQVKIAQQNVNTDLAMASQASIWFPTGGAVITVPAVTAGARLVVGNLALRNALPTVNDEYTVTFGGVDRGETEFSVVATATAIKRTLYAPPAVIGGGGFGLIHVWFPSNITTGASFSNLELGYWER